MKMEKCLAIQATGYPLSTSHSLECSLVYSKTLSMVLVMDIPRAQAILLKVQDDFIVSSGVYAIGSPPFNSSSARFPKKAERGWGALFIERLMFPSIMYRVLEAVFGAEI